jgi:hypothetical protein
MKRRNFIELLTVTGGAVVTASLVNLPAKALAEVKSSTTAKGQESLTADVVVIGGGCVAK